jgi:Zn-dependent protease with chaperone function
MLSATGHVDSWVVQAQGRWRWAAASLLVAALALVAAYHWGLPAAASWIAATLPERVVSQVGTGTLELLDRGLLNASKLPPERQQALARSFGRLLTPDAHPPRYRLQFRDGGRLGPNALSLPDGTIVLTDQLAGLAAGDEEILAVLAHELGHVRHRHGLRLLIEGSIVAFVVSWYVGDYSSLAVAAPTLLLQARYSREHELEADRYAAAMLRANGITPEALASMLGALEAARREDSSSGDRKAAAKRPHFGDYLASHPATRERIEALRAR